jgi:ADP-ribosylglycohydrolase
MNEAIMFDKVYGCWMGKNIGGTLGGPVEGKMELMNYTFYTQQFDGSPMENDDLDLQLLNLHAVEQYGINITSRHLAAEWKSHVFFNMDEYALFLSNARRGVQTPISGHFNNEFVDCMGSPIRSEIWAVLAPGNPKLAAYFAYQDAIVDHAGGEGVYGEVFFAALESMAFENNNLEEITNKALGFIPNDCITALAIKDLIRYYKSDVDWISARQKLIDSYGTSNFCFAPLNIAFTMLGLFYGEDFSDKLLKCLNCGYDTDCTAATAGSILGIMYGADSIPKKWIDPIGTSIVTCPQVNGFRIPKDITELTKRSIKSQKILKACFENCIDKSIFEIDFDINTTKFGVPMDCIAEQDLVISLNYENNQPSIGRNETKKLYLTVENKMPVTYSGKIGIVSLEGLETGTMASFTLNSGEKFSCETYVKGDGNFHATYPLNVVIERYVNNILWSSERFPFALIPTYDWVVSKNDKEKTNLSCPTHRIDFDKIFDINIDDKFTAETVLDMPNELNLRYTVHTAHNNIKLWLDDELILNREVGDPYLPAYHRPAPDAKQVTKAGKHKLKIEVTAAHTNEPFIVAFQAIDLSEVFVKNRGLLHDDIMLSYNFE